MSDRSSSLLPLPAGVVFDLDGTLCDNMPLHVEAFTAFMARHRLPPVDQETRRRLDGRRNRDVMPVLFGRELDDAEFARLEDEKESLYREMSRGRLRPPPGLLPLLDRLEARGIPMAVATSAPRANVEFTLAELGLTTRFAAVVLSDEVPHGKPHPDVFLAAAARLGRDPALCLAFEDAPAGIAAARRAGMRVVAVTTSFPAAELLGQDLPPHAVVPDFEAFLDGPGRGLLALP